jgi:hypothetical protein
MAGLLRKSPASGLFVKLKTTRLPLFGLSQLPSLALFLLGESTLAGKLELAFAGFEGFWSTLEALAKAFSIAFLKSFALFSGPELLMAACRIQKSRNSARLLGLMAFWGFFVREE